MGGSGGGSSGSGGSSGRVDYPDYMKTFHNAMLDHTGVDTPTSSFVDIFNAALSNNPFTSAAAYDPDTELDAMDTAVAAFSSPVNGISWLTDWDSAMEQAVESADRLVEPSVADAVDAYGDVYDDDLALKVIPAFEGGMRNIGAVMTSSFAVGKAIIYGMRDRDVARFQEDLRVRLKLQHAELAVDSAKVIVSMLVDQAKLEGQLANLSVEVERLKIVAKDEEASENLTIDEADALWDMKLIQYGSNLLAGISGGTAVSPQDKPSKTASVLGGALSGAAAGMAISGGNPIGAGIGAVVGGIGSIL